MRLLDRFRSSAELAERAQDARLRRKAFQKRARRDAKRGRKTQLEVEVRWWVPPLLALVESVTRRVRLAPERAALLKGRLALLVTKYGIVRVQPRSA